VTGEDLVPVLRCEAARTQAEDARQAKGKVQKAKGKMWEL